MGLEQFKTRGFFSASKDTVGLEERPDLFVEKTIELPYICGFAGAVVPLGKALNNEQAIAELSLTKTDGINPLTHSEFEELTGFRKRFWVDGVPAKDGFFNETAYRTYLRDHYLVPAGKAAIVQGSEVTGMKEDEIDKWFIGSAAGPEGLPEALLPGRKPFYIWAACPGGGLVLHELWQHEKEYQGKNIGVVFSDILTPLTPPDSTRAIFTDTATFFVIKKYGSAFRVRHSELQVMPDEGQILKVRPLYDSPADFDPYNPSYILQITDGGMTVNYSPYEGKYAVVINGAGLVRWVGNVIAPAITNFIENYNQYHPDDPIDTKSLVVVSHQANGKMLETGLQKKHLNKKFPQIKVPFVMADIGNNSGASLLVAINRILRDPQYFDFSDGKPKRFLAAGFGAGLVYTISLVEVSPSIVSPSI